LKRVDEKSPADFVRPEVLREPLYTLQTPDHRIKLDQNENPFDLREETKQEILRLVLKSSWSRYPEFHQEAVTAALGRREKWPAEGILVGNGSNELLLASFLAVGGAGRTGILVPPTFSLYSKLLMLTGTSVENVPLETGSFEFDVDRIVGALERPGFRFAVLCSPNNPTGSFLGADRLRRILATGRLVILDEAYGEFARERVRPLLDEFNNLVILRTFSKARRLAALRFGFLLASPALAAEIRKAKLPYNVNAVTTAAALHLLEREEAGEVDPSVPLLVSERERLRVSLADAGLPSLPSEANFLLVEPGASRRQELFEAFLARGILVRDFSVSPALAGMLRVSVGEPQENDEVIQTVRDFLGKKESHR